MMSPSETMICRKHYVPDVPATYKIKAWKISDSSNGLTLKC
jgi:hypothetical protein